MCYSSDKRIRGEGDRSEGDRGPNESRGDVSILSNDDKEDGNKENVDKEHI